jgi:hypothetical protein
MLTLLVFAEYRRLAWHWALKNSPAIAVDFINQWSQVLRNDTSFLYTTLAAVFLCNTQSGQQRILNLPQRLHAVWLK